MSYRYWRVKATAMHGSSFGFMSCQELRFLTAYDGPQAATGGTAMSDSAVSGLPASQAFDGSNAMWASNGTGTASWIGYDFGSAVDIKEVWYTPRADSSYQQIFTAANIDGSNDGTTWTTVVSWTPGTWSIGETQAKDVAGSKPADGTAGAGAHRYWRILSRALMAPASGAVGGCMACQQLTWRLTPGGSQVAGGGTPLAGSFFTSSNTPAKAYDGDATTLWASNGIGWDWIGYDFGTALTIAELAYTARNDTNYSQVFTSGVVQSSDDGVTWTTAKVLTPSTWTQGSTQTFTVQAPAVSPSRQPVVFVCT